MSNRVSSRACSTLLHSLFWPWNSVLPVISSAKTQPADLHTHKTPAPAPGGTHVSTRTGLRCAGMAACGGSGRGLGLRALLCPVIQPRQENNHAQSTRSKKAVGRRGPTTCPQRLCTSRRQPCPWQRSQAHGTIGLFSRSQLLREEYIPKQVPGRSRAPFPKDLHVAAPTLAKYLTHALPQTKKKSLSRACACPRLEQQSGACNA